MLARAFGALVLLALAAAFVAGPERAAPRRTRPPDLVIHLVDTLRRDHLGVYGYPRDTSTRLDAFAREALVFDNAFAPSSWTRPSTASLLSGLSPRRHGARSRLGVVPEDAVLLSEALDAAGYTTLAFVANPNVIPLWGFGQGFDEFADLGAVGVTTRADEVVDRVLRRLDALSEDEPFFLYVHTMDPHMPYDPPPPFDRRFTAGPGLTRRYDGEIAFGDEQFGRVIDRLRERGRYDDAVVVFVSDHGEALGEHGGRGHGNTLFEEVIRVPLLIKLPRSRMGGERVHQAATLTDLMPTLLAAMGVAVPEGLDGVDLLSPAFRDAASRDAERPLFFDLELEWTEDRLARARGVRAGRWKLIDQIQPPHGVLFFDLEADPGETTDRSGDATERAAELGAMLDAHVASHAEGVHLRALHAAGHPARRCRAQLETTGRFVSLVRRMLEPGDLVTAAANGERLRVDFTLRNTPHPLGEIPSVVIDEDAIAFEVEPPDAHVELTPLPGSDRGSCGVWLGAAEAPLETATLRFSDHAEPLAVSDPSQLSPRGGAKRPGFHVGVVRAEHAIEVPQSVQARLRALGYVD